MEPAEMEARGVDTVDVEFKGETFTFPATLDKAPFSVLVAMDHDPPQFSKVIQGILGPEEWEKLLAIPGLLIEDAGELFNEYAKVSGQSPGESPAS